MTNELNFHTQMNLNKQMIKLLFVITFCVLILMSATILAAAPLEYNIIPMIRDNSIIDNKVQKKIDFSVAEYTEDIFYNGKQIKLKDNSFSIDVSKLYGNTTIEFINSVGDSVSFNYLLPDKKGKLENYELVSGKNLNVYVTTIKDIKVLYTDKEKSAISKLKTNLNKIPKNVLVNVDEIRLIPFSNTKNIAGTTDNTTIILYNYSKYSGVTQKNIIYHEIAHTWAHKLIDKKIIDYDYTKYSEVVKSDNNFVSTYAKDFAEQNKGKVSEDFADAVAFYIMNQTKFKKQYPNRTEYFKELFEIEL